MGRKNKRYKKTLHQQAQERLESLCAFGRSKSADKAAHEMNYIYSYSTFHSYKKWTMKFIEYVQLQHPNCTTIKAAEAYVEEYLNYRVNLKQPNGENLSAWTISLEYSALKKFYGRNDFKFTPPKRRRAAIKRSRTAAKRDARINPANWSELINFLQGVGLRRSEVEALRKENLFSSEQLHQEIARLRSMPQASRTRDEARLLEACERALTFKNPFPAYFVYVRNSKGGKCRMAPVLQPFQKFVVQRFKETPDGDLVFDYVPGSIDIHHFRSVYARFLYSAYRTDEALPKSELYVCRQEHRGRKFQKPALRMVSRALGHERIDTSICNYLLI